MSVAHDPQDDSYAMAFRTVKRAMGEMHARVGQLSLPGRAKMETPHHLGVTSRGTIPHLSQDTLMQKTDVQGIYVALEDCEWRIPPTNYAFEANSTSD